MGKKKNKQNKEEKQKIKELKRNKIDKLNFAVIMFIMIALPSWQLVRMQFAGMGNYELYDKLHAGYFLWGASIILLITYIINIVKKRIKIDKIDIFIYLFIFSAFISTLLASDLKLAILGITDRYEGILSLISYALIILTVKNLPLKNRYVTIINTFITLGVIQAVIAIIQCFSTSEYVLRFSYVFMANSLCGNPNYLGSYMMINAIIAMGMYLLSEKYNKIYFFCTLLFVFSLILAQSSTPLLGLAFGILFILIYIFKNYKDKIKKAIFIAGLSTIVAVVSIYGTVYLYTDVFKIPVYKNYTIKSDITQFFGKFIGKEETNDDYYKNMEEDIPIEERDNYITDQTFYASRFYIWNISSKIIQKHFFFGCGPDNYALNFKEYSPIYVDRAHNIYIHIFATLGLFGFISYMAIMIATFTKGLFSNNKIAKICFIAFITYLIHAFFSVNVIEVVTYFYIILGIVLASCKNSKEERIYD